MSSIKYPITLDLKRDYHQVLIMKEGDIDSREIIITITDNGQPFPLDNILVKFKWHKPDHHFVFDDCTIQDNNAVIKCNEQMLIVSGIAKVEIVLYDDTTNQTVLSTMTFNVSIRDSVIDNQDIESSNEFGALNNLILSNKNLNDSLRQLESEVEALLKNDNLLHTDDLGVANGVATLDENGNIPANQLPGYVDDVLEGNAVDVSLNEEGNAMYALAFILSGETDACIPESGKIYLDTDTNLQYRWTGSIYISTGSVLELGTTSSTAFPGNRGLSLENRVADIEEYHNNIPAQDIKFDNTSTPLLGANVQDALKELSKDATQTSSGLLSADDKKRIDNYANVKTIEILLLSSNWSGSSAPYTQIVPVEQLSCYNNCSIEMPETATAEQENMIANAEINSITYDETIGLTFTATGAKPTIDIPIQLSVGTSMNVVEIPKYFGETPVTGVKGAAEIEYRNGNVNITPDDIGALPNTEKDSSLEGTLAYTLEEFKHSISIASKTLYSYYADGTSVEQNLYTIPNYISEVSSSLEHIVGTIDALSTNLEWKSVDISLQANSTLWSEVKTNKLPEIIGAKEMFLYDSSVNACTPVFSPILSSYIYYSNGFGASDDYCLCGQIRVYTGGIIGFAISRIGAKTTLPNFTKAYYR